jgi:NAD(P)H-dependent FMN reductase
MITIISCTNRKSAVSKVVSEFYQQLLSQSGAESKILDLQKVPADFIMSALYENAGKNQAFNQMTQQIKSSEKFVFVVPEYNGSFPGVLKSFIDGLSYPNPFKDKKCALVGLSSGVQGGALALSHLTDIFNYLGMHVLALKVRMPGVEKIISNDKVTDDLILELLNMQIKDLLAF